MTGVIPSILLLDESGEHLQTGVSFRSIEYDVLKNQSGLFVARGWTDWLLIILLGEDGIFRPISVVAILSLRDTVKPLEHIEMDISKDFGLQVNKAGPDVSGPFLFVLLIKLQLKSSICAPFTFLGKVSSGIVLCFQRPDRGYTLSDLELINEVSRSEAVAIDNAFFYRESKKNIETREAYLCCLT